MHFPPPGAGEGIEKEAVTLSACPVAGHVVTGPAGPNAQLPPSSGDAQAGATEREAPAAQAVSRQLACA